jgi:hypothetical protein
MFYVLYGYLPGSHLVHVSAPLQISSLVHGVEHVGLAILHAVWYQFARKPVSIPSQLDNKKTHVC